MPLVLLIDQASTATFTLTLADGTFLTCTNASTNTLTTFAITTVYISPAPYASPREAESVLARGRMKETYFGLSRRQF
jgi:hypothetical protein